MIRVMIYYLLSSISVLGDSIFLYFVSLTLLQTEQGGMLCSIILGMDAFLEILVGPYLAKFIDAIPDLSMRLRRSIVIQVGLLGLSLLPALVMLGGSSAIFLLVATFAVMRFFILVDNQLRAAIPLNLDKRGRISLMQSLSLSTFSQRCIFLVSSTLSPLLVGRSWLFASTINSVTYIFALFALLVILKITSSPSPVKEEKEAEFSATSYSEKERKGWLQWNCLSYLLSNFAFGGVILILTKSMLQASGDSFFDQALHGPAPIYGGLLIALILLMIYHKKSNALANIGPRLSMVFSLGIGLILASIIPGSLKPPFLFLIGILNGFSLVASEAFLQRKMEGKDFVKAVAKSTAFGRVGFVLSLACVGFCIDLGLSTNWMLAASGAFAAISATILFFLAIPLEKERTTSFGK